MLSAINLFAIAAQESLPIGGELQANQRVRALLRALQTGTATLGNFTKSTFLPFRFATPLLAGSLISDSTTHVF
ncbi:hypothetical protein NPIL_175911 [Nephila pilipes]|uniref:Uncharacterized protein n=1 Tax=Nephila pilipes TaxID=299642 RepID=A0A8X6UUR2_NEPPI|nr:hypothetical protein NPIL_175911 [Nephila pilipes]